MDSMGSSSLSDDTSSSTGPDCLLLCLSTSTFLILILPLSVCSINLLISSMLCSTNAAPPSIRFLDVQGTNGDLLCHSLLGGGCLPDTPKYIVESMVSRFVVDLVQRAQ